MANVFFATLLKMKSFGFICDFPKSILWVAFKTTSFVFKEDYLLKENVAFTSAPHPLPQASASIARLSESSLADVAKVRYISPSYPSSLTDGATPYNNFSKI